MLDRLEKFRAPPSWHHLLPGGIILALALVACKLDLASERVNERVIAEKSQQAEAAQRTPASQVVLPLAFPLGCPEEDALGRKLSVSVWMKGEKMPRCYYK